MNNKDLELKIKEILSIENFFDMIEAVVLFDKEYKQTDFYKNTKMKLSDVVKGAKLWYAFQLNDITNKIQKTIDNLDMSNVMNVIDNIGNMYTQENQDIMDIINSFKEIAG